MLVMSVRCAADSWISIGKVPNASTGLRRFAAKDTDYDFVVNPGDKLAWIAA